MNLKELSNIDEWKGKFNWVIAFEVIEHILDDKKFFIDATQCLIPGGRLLVTTPYLHYKPISKEDNGPFEPIEDGRHVRRGYSKAMLFELCKEAKVIPEEISYCSGFISQKVTALMRKGEKIYPFFGWTLSLPLRPIIPFLDPIFTKCLQWPFFSICLEAYKPSYAIN
ncbi:hypothetical protein kam1_1673 [Methylacidiphilum kamchatkense Kam1]|uniref:Methyltransferase family protein n=1 Tax=Methylacidiphilum kamchatkense Kam1 TaxID=1202785 RepID=A0A516TNT1_9BACT|nr:hypothetical protein [Methylacidiphilum kamchatkense]QDQ42888.1 hypothetical protein kam1_1673 [Methylacidiphilum kamchatkense Kam1]